MNGLVLVLLAAVAATDPVAFPGPAEAPDPTNRYAVICEAPAPGAAGGGEYALDLRAGPSGQTRNLLSFRRVATVLWAPDGNALAITVRDSSDASSVRVFFPDRPNESVDMGAQLTKSFGRMPEREDNRHVYIEADRWLSPKTLRFRMRGYGERDRQGFDELFDYALGGRVERAKSIVAALAAGAIATRTPIPSPTPAAAPAPARELAKAEYAVRWDPAKGGPRDAREVLSLLGGKEKEGESFEVEYFDLPTPPSAPADAVTILRRRRKSGGKGEIRLKYRRDRPLEGPWSCPAGSAFAQSEEEDFSFSGMGPPVRVYSYSCSLDGVEPPASLSAVPKPCSSRMVRYASRGLKVEEWSLPGGDTRVEVSRSAKNTADEIASFEEIVARLLERGAHPSDGSKAEIASQCPVTAAPTRPPALIPTPPPASHDGNPFWVAGVDDPARVRDFLSAFKSAVAANDAGAVAALTSFPLEVSIDGRRQRVASGARFVQLYKEIFTPCLERVVAAATSDELFANANGVMFGSGAIWFSPVSGGALRIITINGPMAREKLCEEHP